MTDVDDGRTAARTLPGPLHVANEGLAFLLEIIALVALAWWGFHTGDGPVPSVLLGVGAPLLAAVVWGLFASPRARVRLPFVGVLAVKVVVYAVATAALDAVGHPVAAVVFAVVAAANTLLVTADRRAAVRNRT
jgi:Protein of unknown function (DUF2568)